jgi:hypothetical protein
MARREEGEYSTYSTDEQQRQRAKDQARWEQYGAVETLASLRPQQDGSGTATTPTSAAPLGTSVWFEDRVGHKTNPERLTVIT